ncbi:MAG: hypothetical protein AAGB02_09575 [Pseudomonadota bacterium]
MKAASRHFMADWRVILAAVWLMDGSTTSVLDRTRLPGCYAVISEAPAVRRYTPTLDHVDGLVVDRQAGVTIFRPMPQRGWASAYLLRRFDVETSASVLASLEPGHCRRR